LLDEPLLARRLARAAQQTAAGLTWDARAERVLQFLEQRRALQNERPAEKSPLRAG
jgi:hypothetical protein